MLFDHLALRGDYGHFSQAFLGLDGAQSPQSPPPQLPPSPFPLCFRLSAGARPRGRARLQIKEAKREGGGGAERVKHRTMLAPHPLLLSLLLDFRIAWPRNPFLGLAAAAALAPPRRRRRGTQNSVVLMLF